MKGKATREWNFSEQLKVGSRGEELFLERYPRKLSVHPENDGDFIVDCTGEKIELKTDTYNMDKTPNFFMERWSDVYGKKPGGPWQAREHGCDIYIYYFVRHNLWFEFRDLPNLTAELDLLTEKKGLVYIKNKTWITGGYLIPRTKLEDLYDIYEF